MTSFNKGTTKEDTCVLRVCGFRNATFWTLLGLVCLGALPAPAATLTVTNTNDSGPGSLRQAIASALSGDIIKFSLAYPAAITLASQLTIATDLTISGPGASNLAISGNQAVPVFYVGSATRVSGITVENGKSDFGGGIRNAGALTLANTTVSGNSATVGGGGIYNEGSLTMTNSRVSGNSASTFGGGIANGKEAVATLANTTVSGNSAATFGGGISNAIVGTLTLANTTVSGNSASIGGGGISNAGTLTLANSTVFGNSAASGGGFYIADTTSFNTNTTVKLSNTTVSGNSATYGGGIDNANNAPATVMLKNTIIANSGAGGDCYSSGTFPFLSFGHNLSDDGTCSSSLTATGDLNNTPAGLDPSGLENNGGTTSTIALLPLSPAVDAIALGYCTTIDAFLVATDQRGVPRPQGRACDIGAFELVKAGSE